MMKALKNKSFVRGLVIVLTLGLVGTYMPLLFSNPTPQDQLPPQSASLVEPETMLATSTPPTSTSVIVPVTLEKPKPITSPEGFSGLQEEGKSLDDLNNLLNE
ncbi:hypothetical protein HY967_02375 [Candidatus Jorgensenbacteria bacterium]|nr:hypothetical protein [Candidatus Jorgensenbacteria bacterium]